MNFKPFVWYFVKREDSPGSHCNNRSVIIILNSPELIISDQRSVGGEEGVRGGVGGEGSRKCSVVWDGEGTKNRDTLHTRTTGDCLEQLEPTNLFSPIVAGNQIEPGVL